MMKKIKKNPTEPKALHDYKRRHPNATWGQFCKQKRKKKVVNQLRSDQGGICCYCEIDLAVGGDQERNDRRVEHFIPKSKKGTRNYHLEWGNLFACCHGGAEKYVVFAKERYTAPDLHCDAIKSDKDLSRDILNPLRIPAFPCLFKFSRNTGKMSVDVAACKMAHVRPAKATRTINELNLNQKKLCNNRKNELDSVNSHLVNLMGRGLSLADARDRMARSLLRKNKDGNWPRFFSAIRNYLGEAAEKQLRKINFDG